MKRNGWKTWFRVMFFLILSSAFGFFMWSRTDPEAYNAWAGEWGLPKVHVQKYEIKKTGVYQWEGVVKVPTLTYRDIDEVVYQIPDSFCRRPDPRNGKSNAYVDTVYIDYNPQLTSIVDRAQVDVTLADTEVGLELVIDSAGRLILEDSHPEITSPQLRALHMAEAQNNNKFYLRRLRVYWEELREDELWSTVYVKCTYYVFGDIKMKKE